MRAQGVVNVGCRLLGTDREHDAEASEPGASAEVSESSLEYEQAVGVVGCGCIGMPEKSSVGRYKHQMKHGHTNPATQSSSGGL